MPWAALGTAVAGLGAAAWNYFSNIEQNERNLEQWQRENSYNLPINQVSRLKMAGLNPALMYQNGASGLTSASSPEMQGNGQIDPLVASQIALNTAQAKGIEHQTKREDEKQPITIETLKKGVEELSSKIRLNFSTSSLNDALSEKADQETKNLALDWEYNARSLADRLLGIASKAKISKAEADNIDEKIKLDLSYTRRLIQSFNDLKEHYIRQDRNESTKISNDFFFKSNGTWYERQMAFSRAEEVYGNLVRIGAEISKIVKEGRLIDAQALKAAAAARISDVEAEVAEDTKLLQKINQYLYTAQNAVDVFSSVLQSVKGFKGLKSGKK